MKERPSTEQVDSLSLAMDEVGKKTKTYLADRPNAPVEVDRNFGWLLCKIFAKCGPRFRELIALTVESFAST